MVVIAVRYVLVCCCCPVVAFVVLVLLRLTFLRLYIVAVVVATVAGFCVRVRCVFARAHVSSGLRAVVLVCCC